MFFWDRLNCEDGEERTNKHTNKPKTEYEEKWDVVILIGSIAMGCIAILFVWSKHVWVSNGLILEWWSENRNKNVCFGSEMSGI